MAKDGADSSMTRTIMPAKGAVAGLNRIAARTTGGMSWVSSHSHFPAIGGS